MIVKTSVIELQASKFQSLSLCLGSPLMSSRQTRCRCVGSASGSTCSERKR